MAPGSARESQTKGGGMNIFWQQNRNYLNNKSRTEKELYSKHKTRLE
jgi:hypothetical protein